MEAVGIFEIAGFHPPHADIADDRDRTHRVQGSAPSHRPQPGAGPDRELDDAHLEQLGEREVARFVRRDQEKEHHRIVEENFVHDCSSMFWSTVKTRKKARDKNVVNERQAAAKLPD